MVEKLFDDPDGANDESKDSQSPEKSSEEDAASKKTSADIVPYRLPVPHWIISFVGHIIAAAMGLGAGYLLLHWLRPEKFPLRW